MSEIAQKLPERAREYYQFLIRSREFNLALRKSRKTKLGDFRYDNISGIYNISVNDDLEPFTFLITFLHEIAHYDVAISNLSRQRPHGLAWKTAFRAIMAPVLNGQVFPAPILESLKAHMENPKASLGADINLWSVLNKQNGRHAGQSLLQIPDGEAFSFKGQHYKKLRMRRTRSLCMNLATNKKYLISGIAEVKHIM